MAMCGPSPSLFQGAVIAGPMVRVSSLAFRLLCANQGANIVFTEEMVAAKISKATREIVTYDIPTALLPVATKNLLDASGAAQFLTSSTDGGNVTRVRVAEYVVLESFKNMLKRQVVFATLERRPHPDTLLMDVSAEGCPLIAQLGASDPSVAAAAASVICDDVDGIDINMGCPKKFSMDNGMGAALMRTPDRAGEILRAINEAINSEDRLKRRGGRRIAVSFKTRVFDDVAKSVDQLLRVMQASRNCVHAITLHARTRDQRSETPPLRTHAELVVQQCRTLHPDVFGNICFVFNGSVDSHDAAKKVLESQGSSGFGGVMISRGAMWDPSVFSTTRHSEPPVTADDANQSTILRVFQAMVLLHRAYHTNFIYLKYHMTRSFQEFPVVKRLLHPRMQQAFTYAEFAEIVGFPKDVAQQQFGTVTYEELLPAPPREKPSSSLRPREGVKETGEPPTTHGARVEAPSTDASS